MNADDLFKNAVNHWRDAKGVGTALIPAPLDDKGMIIEILQRLYNHNPDSETVIIVNSFEDRNNIISFIRTNDKTNKLSKLINIDKIKVCTDYFIKKSNITSKPTLCIWYKAECDYNEIFQFVKDCKFKLIIISSLLKSFYFMDKIYKIAPLLEDFKAKQIEQLRLSTPVEECQIGITIPKDSEEFDFLNQCNEYITTSVSIFGSFEVIQQANNGNKQLNISATQICNQIAQENGWNEYLDMSIEFNCKIDELYNPGSLRERASQTFNIVRERSKLLSDYKGKLDVILDIIRNNDNKKILIINKHAEFASEITEYLNKAYDKLICMNYHDKTEPIPAIDADGTPIFYKTGNKKGKRKMMGSKAQKTLAMTLFNNNTINILSTNNAPDKDLNIDVDLIIITSPMCETVSSYMYRLSGINFRQNKIDLYSIYCRDTLEQKLIENKALANNHNIKNSFSEEDIPEFAIAD